MRCIWLGGPHDGQQIVIPDEQAASVGGIEVAIPPILSAVLADDDPTALRIEKVFVPLVRTKTRNYLDWNQRRSG